MAEDKIFKTRELERAEQAAGYAVWFRLATGERLIVEMSLGGLLTLQGMVNRAVESLGASLPNEMNAHPVVPTSRT